ncbi:MAG: hypothetical protein F9K13_08535 [Candidatus Methylomirabilis oxygeniifera]|uniref:Membrane protein 6-pyruvoyl-tetrahydropterin synthase-related domain-containing protein n=1 Tax=Methylomirabilis oxygeniifera TaxID=671143 RepID=D5MJ24_METO1|nr:MAG: hypothetical protein F9K13_08535 [Candidatus Methylomirabilis oxyfera]CBE67389.1 membrane protein of unknown function [Candidatus Methylomirabilis oxyfera]
MVASTDEPEMDTRRGRIEVISTAVVLALIYGVLLWQFPPSLLLLPTITAGGDTLFHYVTAAYLRDHLLAHGRIVGWMPGNLAGFPLFLFYFPLAFLAVCGLSLIAPFPVAFKLGTVAGTFALPLASYVALRWIGLAYPTPAIGALFTLCFLFIESNTMWGGNIPSTLAGEFAYSFSLPLLVLFLGALYRGVEKRRHAWLGAGLLALVGFSHGYTLVMAAGAGLFFLVFNRDMWATLWYLLRVYGIGGLLLGFWILPLVMSLPYTSGWPISWQFTSLLEPLPIILWPIVAAAIVTIAAAFRRPKRPASNQGQEWMSKVHYLSFPVALGILLFSLAARLNLVDIRFLSIAQFFITLVAAAGFGKAWPRLAPRLRAIALVVLALITILWALSQQSYSRDWIVSNYRGMESAPLWKQYRVLNEVLKGGPQDPRIMYEHSGKHEGAGTVRAFEALPLFSGRSTLEGAYMQSSLSAPFIFDLQSELTPTPSCPFPQYRCSRFDPDRAVRHLVLFNVKGFIAVSSEVKAALDAHPAFRRALNVEPYAIYEVLPGNGRYVVPLSFQPTVSGAKDWKRLAYDWFQRPEWAEVPLIFPQGDEPPPTDAVAFHGLEQGPVKVPLADACHVEETVLEQEIRFQTDCPGRPHLVKVSYHPKWRAEGADRIYLTSPAFMVVYPADKQVRLAFGDRWPDTLGWIATALGLLWLLAEARTAAPRRR